MSRKFLVTIVLILFLLPIGSWYYLQSGLDWRKEAQAIMSGSTVFPTFDYSNDTGMKFTPEVLDEHVTLVSFVPCSGGEEQIKLIEDIYNQFADSKKANIILFDSCQSNVNGFSHTSQKNWYQIPCSALPEICAQLSAEWTKGTAFALVDRKHIIRSYYPAQSAEEKRLLVEHMALLLPRERQEKVELKRGDKK
jgi:hypothetical protein